MGVAPTGNGRRESYAHRPMPRMTNTFMTAGDHDPREILSRVKNGIYAVNFGGGQVDITTGKFVFSCTEAYRVENGKIGAPIKGATLIGDGPDALTRVKMVGNDLKLDEGVGTCGKGGQSVPGGRRPADALDRGADSRRYGGVICRHDGIRPPRPHRSIASPRASRRADKRVFARSWLFMGHECELRAKATCWRRRSPAIR